MSRKVDNEELIRKARDFHGHMCPGLAIGIRASEIALAEIGRHTTDQEIVAVVETDMCGVDAIQVLTGCTFGKGNLIHRDYGKKAFNFYRRSDGKAIRIVTQPSAMASSEPERNILLDKHRQGTMTAEDKTRFAESQENLVQKIFDTPLERLFHVLEISEAPPQSPRLHRSVSCEMCGEETMETRVRERGGRNLCIPCSEK